MPSTKTKKLIGKQPSKTQRLVATAQTVSGSKFRNMTRGQRKELATRIKKDRASTGGKKHIRKLVKATITKKRIGLPRRDIREG